MDRTIVADRSVDIDRTVEMSQFPMISKSDKQDIIELGGDDNADDSIAKHGDQNQYEVFQNKVKDQKVSLSKIYANGSELFEFNQASLL